MNNKDRITLRLNGNQKLVLDEMVEALDTSYSLLIRTIVSDWLTHNEEYIYRIIDKKRIQNADNQQDTEEAQINLPQ